MILSGFKKYFQKKPVHWTQRAENRDKVEEINRKMIAARQRKAKARAYAKAYYAKKKESRNV